MLSLVPAATGTCHARTRQAYAVHTTKFTRCLLGISPSSGMCMQPVLASPRRHLTTRGRSRTPALLTVQLPALLPLSGGWGVWAGLIAAGAFGSWSERTPLGKELSGALVATLAGMLLANIGVLPHGASELDVVFKSLLPLAIPMLLYSADLRRIVAETGRLLLAFLLAAAATIAGTFLAMKVFSLTPALGDEGWKIAAALTARHIGGAVNYMAVSEALSIGRSTFGAGLAADDLILTLYFTTLYALAKGIPRETPVAVDISSNGSSIGSSSSSPALVKADGSLPGAPVRSGLALDPISGGGHGGGSSGGGRTIKVVEGLLAVALSAVICYICTSYAAAFGIGSQCITLITAATVLLATLFPRPLAPLVESGEGLALIIMQVFFAAVGASAQVALVVRTAPVLFCFSALALAAHLGILFAVGSAAGFTRRELVLASNATIGGPSTVAGMAAAKGWRSMLVPAILTSTLGYAIGSFLGIGFGYGVLRRM